MPAWRWVVAVTAASAVVAIVVIVAQVMSSGNGTRDPAITATRTPSTGAAASPTPRRTGPLTEKLQEIVDRLPDPAGSNDMDQMQGLVGLPDAFTVAFEPQDDGTISRRDQWYYYDLATVFEFVDGVLLWNLPLDEEVEFLVHPIRYDPGSFRADSTWESLAPVVGDQTAFDSFPLDPEYQADVTVYVGGLLLLLFDERGLLLYVEAVPVGRVSP